MLLTLDLRSSCSSSPNRQQSPLGKPYHWRSPSSFWNEMKRKEIGKLYLLQVSFAHFLREEVPSSLPLPHLTLATVTVRVILLRNPTLAKDLLLGKLIAHAPKVKKSAPNFSARQTCLDLCSRAQETSSVESPFGSAEESFDYVVPLLLETFNVLRYLYPKRPLALKFGKC